MDKAISRLWYQEIVGRTQVGRAALGWGTAPELWSTATKMKRKDLVIAEVARAQEAV